MLLAIGLLISSTIVSSMDNKPRIEIVNNTDNALKVEHNIPQFTKALIFLELTKLKPSNDSYTIIELPENFLACDDGCVLNNNGQVAGYTFIKNGPPLKPNLAYRGTQFQKGEEKNYNKIAAVWDTTKGLISSGLKNSRAVSLNNLGFVAITRDIFDMPSPNVLWDMATNDLVLNHDFKKQTTGSNAIKLFISGQHSVSGLYRFRLDSNEKGSDLLISNNSDVNSELFLHYAGKDRLILFPHEFFINTARARTGLPIINARLNNNDEVIALLKNGNDYIIGKWQKDGRITISEPLRKKPELKLYSSFEILGFNNKGQILIRADITDMQQIEYKPNKPQLFLFCPSRPSIENLNDFRASIKDIGLTSACINVSGNSANEQLIDLFIKFMKHPIFINTTKTKKSENNWDISYTFKSSVLNKREFQSLLDLAVRHDYNADK